MKKLNPVKLGNSIALAFALIHISFDILSLLAPNMLKFIFNTWFHGFNLKILVLEETFSISAQNILIGLVTSVVVAWIIGFSVGYFYNYFNKDG